MVAHGNSNERAHVGRMEVLAVAATGQPLGILPHPVFDLQVRVLAPGDIVVLYTDGITEAINAEGQFFGQDRLQTIVSDRYTYADSLCDHVLQSAAIFQGLAPQQDDMTLLVVRVACD